MSISTLEYLQTNRSRFLNELLEFIRIPSISTDPAFAQSVYTAAEWVTLQIESVGPFETRLIRTQCHPIIYAEWLGAPGSPTVLVYGHYDVQPPGPLSQWHNDPFQPDIRQGCVFARGASDDKGPMFTPIKVAEAFFASEGRLPINVKLLFEGEEEMGSPSLKTFISENRSLLAADFAISADGPMWRSDGPSITISSRGLIGLELTVTAASKDLHSGRHGGCVANPLHALAQLIASLHHADGRVRVAGFYDKVEELSTYEREAIASLPFEEAAYLRTVGAPATFGEPGYSTLERQWIRPTVECNGMWGGYQGTGSQTVIPSEAHAKLTCRLVPDQEPDAAFGRVAEHLEKHVPSGVQVRIERLPHRARPYRIPSDHVGLRIAEDVLRSVCGKKPLRVHSGGTIPVLEWFSCLLGLHTIFFSFATADEDAHAPNEFFRIQRLHEGLVAWAVYWEAIKEMVTRL